MAVMVVIGSMIHESGINHISGSGITPGIINSSIFAGCLD